MDAQRMCLHRGDVLFREGKPTAGFVVWTDDVDEDVAAVSFVASPLREAAFFERIERT